MERLSKGWEGLELEPLWSSHQAAVTGHSASDPFCAAGSARCRGKF